MIYNIIMKYKILNIEQIKISLDRLTRFKNTKEKYIRVFTDIISSNLIEPKYKKSELLNLAPKKILEYIEEIFNNSVPLNINFNNQINVKLRNYENSIYNNDEYTNILLNNKINYAAALSMLNENIPVNVKWLKSLENISNFKENRELHYLKFPIEKVILVEGITEEILLPAFSRYLGFDFYQKGIQIIPAGGKNQVVKMYYKLIEELKIPIFLLLDKDADDNRKQIEPKLRNIDKIHLVNCGEFEDLLPLILIIKSINFNLKNISNVSEKDFDLSLPQVKNLENIYKTKGIHEFKKAEFAKLIKENITEDTDISKEIKEIIKEISNNLNKTLDSEICSC